MQFLRRFSPAALLSSALILTSCSATADNSSSANENQGNRVASVPRKANDKPEELGMLINFTLQPEDIVWRQIEAPSKIVAVFRLGTEDSKSFVQRLSEKGQGAAKTVLVEDWFPAELIAGGENSGNSSVDGTAYPADEFFQPPYNKGTITRINDTDFFVLELMAA